jgi:Protein of unknown function, DUF481
MLPQKRRRSDVILRLTLILFFGWFTVVDGAVTTLTLKNGDRVTGDIVSEQGDKIVLKSALFGEIQLAKDQVAKREPALPSPTTPAATTNAPVAPKASLPTNAIAGFNPITNAPPGIYSRWFRPMLTNWHGNVQVGMDLGYGTTERRTFYANATATHELNRVRNLVEYHMAYGILNQVESANKMDGAVKTDVDLGAKRRLYIYDQMGAGYDDLRQITLEFHEGAGLGYKVLQRKKLILNLETGAEYQHRDLGTAITQSFFSIRFGESLTWKAIDKLTITQRLSYNPNLSDFNDYRMRLDISASYPFLKKMTVNLNVIDQYDSTKQLGVRHNDLEIQSTIGVGF